MGTGGLNVKAITCKVTCKTLYYAHTYCITPMIVLSSCYEDSCSYDFSHCASLHHPSFDEMIFPLVPLIFFQGSSLEIVLANADNKVSIPCATIRARAN